MINKQALRAAGHRAELWSDRLAGGAAAFAVTAVWTNVTALWVPFLVLATVALALFGLSLVIGGRS